jgi:hypothetical protein
MSNTRNHDERAALVCLLTAAGVAEGKYTAVGNAATGYFFLPPWSMWQSWARQEIDIQRCRTDCIDVWIDGRCHTSLEALPEGE